MKQDVRLIHDVVNQVKDGVKDLAAQRVNELASSNSESNLSLKDDVSHLQQDVRNLTERVEELSKLSDHADKAVEWIFQVEKNLTGRVEELSKLSERNLIAHTELKACTELNLESLTALIGDLADKHAKEIDALVDKKSESFKTIARDLQGQVEDLARIAGQTVIRLSNIFSSTNDETNQVKANVKDLAAQIKELAQMSESSRLQCKGLEESLASSSNSNSILSLKDYVQQEVRNLTGRVEGLSRVSESSLSLSRDNDIWVAHSELKTWMETRLKSQAALMGDHADKHAKENQPLVAWMETSLESQAALIGDIRNLADRMEEVAQMSEASQWQCKFLEESLFSLSNSGAILSLKDDASHVQQEVRNLTGRVEELSKSKERSLAAHTELKACMEKNLESLTASIGDMADKHAKEIDALVDKKTESFKAVARDLEGPVDKLAQIAVESDIDSMKHNCSLMNGELNQVKEDVKNLAAQMEELVPMNESIRLQCKGFEERLESLTASIGDLADLRAQEIEALVDKKSESFKAIARDLQGQFKELAQIAGEPKVNESILSLSRDNDIWVAHSELKTWMETRLKSQAALMGDHAHKHAKEIQALVAWMEISLESQAALIGEDAEKHAKEIEAFVAKKSGSFKAMARDLEGRVEEFSWTMASIAGGSDSNQRSSMNDEVNRIKHDVKDFTAQIEELSQMNEASRLPSRVLEESLASSSNSKSILSLIDDVSNVQQEVRYLSGRVEALSKSNERGLVAHTELKTCMEKNLESLTALIGDLADKHAMEIDALVDQKSASFMAITCDLEGRVEALAQIAGELAQIAGRSGSDSMKQDFCSMNDEVNQVKDDVRDLATQMQCKSLEDNLAKSQSILSLKDDVSHVQQEVRQLRGRVEELPELRERSLMLSRHKDIWVAHSELKAWMETSLDSQAALIGHHADKHAKEIQALVVKVSESFKALARDLEGRVDKLAQIAVESDSDSMKQNFSLMNDEVNQVKDDVKDLAAQMEELVQMSESSRLQCKGLEESLASSSNSETILSLIEDGSHVQQEVRKLTGRMEALSQSSERSLVAHTELKTCMEKNLESLTASIGDLADKHAKEIDALVDNKTESFKAIARDLEGRVDKFAQIAVESDSNSMKHNFSLMNDEVNQVKDDVKDLAAQMDELVQMSETSQWQCKFLEESLESLTASIGDLEDKHAKEIDALVDKKTESFKTIARDLEVRVDKLAQIAVESDSDSMKRNFSSMNDEVKQVKDDVKDLAAQMEELVQMSESSRLQCKGLEESLASSRNSESILSLIEDGSHVQQEVRYLTGRVEALSKSSERSLVAHTELKTCMEKNLESLTASIGDLADKHAKEIDALVDNKTESFKAIARDLEGRVDKLAQIAIEPDSDSVKHNFSLMNAEVNQVKDDVKNLAAQIEELVPMNESIRLQCKGLEESLASSSNSKTILSLTDDASHVQQEVMKLTGRVEALSKSNERGLVAHTELRTCMEKNLESLTASIVDMAGKHAKEIDALVDKKAESFKAIAKNLEGRVDKLAQITIESDSDSLKHNFSLIKGEVNQVKDDVKNLAAQMEMLVPMNESIQLQCKGLEESLASSSNSKTILSLIDDASHVRQEVMKLTGRVEELSVSGKNPVLSRDNDIWVAWMETSLEELSKSIERSLVAHTELKSCTEKNLESLTALIGDHADKHAKEIEALVVKVNGSFNAIAGVLEGRAEEVNLVREDVKLLAGEMQELASTVRRL